MEIGQKVKVYCLRFRKVVEDSDVWKSVSPFIQPRTSAVLNVSWTGDNFASEPTKQATNLLEEGKAALTDPKRVAAYLVTTDAPTAIATARYLWSSTQQVGLTVGGILSVQGDKKLGLISLPAMFAITTEEQRYTKRKLSRLLFNAGFVIEKMT